VKNFLCIMTVYVGCFVNSYCEIGDSVNGSLIFSFYPTGTEKGGTWTPVILTPSGEYISGEPVLYDSTDRVDLKISCCLGVSVELGVYAVELKNNLTGSVDGVFLNKIVVTPTIPTIHFDIITYKSIPVSSKGENVLIPYFLPSMKND
jgi:hypothetical protein